MKFNLFFLNNLLLNLEQFLKKPLSIIFNYFIGFDKMPLLLRNIEFIRVLQTIVFFLLQASLTTTWFLNQLKKIESKFIYLDKKFQLKKWIEKKMEKFPTKLKRILKNSIIFIQHIKKFKMYNLWGWWRLESFPFPSSFIRYFYVSKSSSAFVKRSSAFLKRVFILKLVIWLLNYLLFLNYTLIIEIMKSLVIYKRFWVQQLLLQQMKFY